MNRKIVRTPETVLRRDVGGEEEILQMEQLYDLTGGQVITIVQKAFSSYQLSCLNFNGSEHIFTSRMCMKVA
jgi:hypothetical protein